LLRTLTSEQNDIILSLALDNENHLFTGSFNGLISVWNLDTGGCVRSFRGHEEKINALLFTKSSHLASGSADHEIKLWNALSLTDNSIATLRGHEKSVLCLAVGKSDEELISGSADFTIRLWNLSTSECVRTLYGHEGIVRTITVGKSGELYSGSNDKSIKVWSLDKGENDECVKTLIDHNESVTGNSILIKNLLVLIFKRVVCITSVGIDWPE
jgi:WD40 repeat protein